MDAVGIARRWVVIERKFATGGEHGLALCHDPHPKLGALEIGENPNWSAHLFLNGAHRLIPRPVVFMGAMAEVEAKDIRPCLVKRLDHLGGRTGWTEGGNHSGISLAAHGVSP